MDSLVCFLCGEELSGTGCSSLDDQKTIFAEHLSDVHETIFNTDFLFAATKLSNQQRQQSREEIMEEVKDEFKNVADSETFKTRMGKVIVDFENGRQCNFCDLWFTRPWCLKQHLPKCEVKNKLYDESKIKFECRFCYKNFKMKRYLRNHEESHRDITTKPYSCFYIGIKC